ncbi:MAG: hypothetical protein LBL82_01940 [Oscillospiraceae bacterium]|nr:hypothetical protein [Oscillospiraceae bacterium]
MKKFLCIAIALMILTASLSSCDGSSDSTVYPKFTSASNEELGCVELHYNGVTYRPFGSFSSSADNRKYKGEQIGVREETEDSKIYAINGFSSEEWIVDYLEVIMGGSMIFKAVGVTEIPPELEQFKYYDY